MGKVSYLRYANFSSSNIKNTKENLARPFIISLDLMGLLHLVLYWVAGDGCIEITPVQDSNGNQFFRCVCIRLKARGDKILPLLKEALAAHGFQESSILHVTTSGINRLIAKDHTRIKEFISQALSDVPEAILHSKLKLLVRFLQTASGYLLVSVGSSQLPFYDYCCIQVCNSGCIYFLLKCLNDGKAK